MSAPGRLPDLAAFPPDLALPPVRAVAPAPGIRAEQRLPAYRGTDVHHLLYLPSDWQPGARYPVVVEYPGNGPYANDLGDISTGEVEGCCLGYGLSAGAGVIWISMPFIEVGRRENARQWWGDLPATLDYCRQTIARVCGDYGGDAGAILLAGFSRGAIACNYVGLHDDTIAGYWRAFFAHSNYDGLQLWDYPGSDRASALARLRRLRGRPVFISHETTTAATQAYLAATGVLAPFTFVDLPFPNHRNDWVLRALPARDRLRGWFRDVLG